MPWCRPKNDQVPGLPPGGEGASIRSSWRPQRLGCCACPCPTPVSLPVSLPGLGGSSSLPRAVSRRRPCPCATHCIFSLPHVCLEPHIVCPHHLSCCSRGQDALPETAFPFWSPARAGTRRTDGPQAGVGACGEAVRGARESADVPLSQLTSGGCRAVSVPHHHACRGASCLPSTSGTGKPQPASLAVFSDSPRKEAVHTPMHLSGILCWHTGSLPV